jgi:Tol biopolymer transport system component
MRVCWDAEANGRAPCGALSTQNSRFLPISRIFTGLPDAAALRDHRGVRRALLALLVAVAIALGFWIAGRFGSKSGLFVVSAAGEKPRKVVGGCIEGFAWSPDGKSIAFGRLLDANGTDRETKVVDLQSKKVHLLLKDGRPEPPSWSPDSSRVAFDGEYGIYVGTRDGPTRARLISDAAAAYWPAWSPDGDWIAYSTAQQVGLVSSDGAVRKHLTKEYTAGLDVPVRWFADGRVMFISGKEGFGVGPLKVVNSNGTGIRRITSKTVDFFAISPDEKRIAYSAQRTIYVAKADGSDRRRIAVGDLGGWSPDGKQLIFTDDAVYVINADGGGKKRIASDVSGDGIAELPWASWSSRGDIAYIVDDPGCGGSD